MTRRRKDPAAEAAPITIPAILRTDVLGRLAALKAATTPELREQWRALFGAEPPPYGRRMLEGRMAYRVQELASGGLKPETVARLEALCEQLDGGNVVLRRIRRNDQRPVAGTRLIREYQGVEHMVTVLRDGFEWQGRPYRSLSAVARAITGTRWNGPLFFGIRSHRSGGA
jgi:Protein of unknown function (DUF2924)